MEYPYGKNFNFQNKSDVENNNNHPHHQAYGTGIGSVADMGGQPQNNHDYRNSGNNMSPGMVPQNYPKNINSPVFENNSGHSSYMAAQQGYPSHYPVSQRIERTDSPLMAQQEYGYNKVTPQGGVQHEASNDLMDRVKVVVMQLNQLRSQVANLQRSSNPQAQEILSQMIMKSQYLQNVYSQLVGAAPPLSLQIPTAHMNPHQAARHPMMPQASPISQQGQMGGMHMMPQQQQRGMNNGNPGMQSVPVNYNQRYNMQQEQYAMNNQRQGYPYQTMTVGDSRRPQNQFGYSQPMMKKRNRYSESGSEDNFSSSPEPTRREVDEMFQMIGPVRRSTRNRKPKNYTQNNDYVEYTAEDRVEMAITEKKRKKHSASIMDSKEPLPVGQENTDNSVAIIDKILGDRPRKTPVELENVLPETEYLVKYKYYSYLHCEWVTHDEMRMRDRMATNKVKRYHMKKPQHAWQIIDDEYFNPDYVEVDRLLAKTETTHIVPVDEAGQHEGVHQGGPSFSQGFPSGVAGNSPSYTGVPPGSPQNFSGGLAGGPTLNSPQNPTLNPTLNSPKNLAQDGALNVAPGTPGKTVTVVTTHYLVKWCSLPYEDSTWEPEELIDKASVENFHKRENGFSPEKTRYISRPNISTWFEIKEAMIFKNDNILREYQLEGVNWLRYCYYRWQNCILADEMGLGKTIQSISFLSNIHNLGIKGPFLIIAPLSTIHNWYREFRNWTDINVIVFHGSAYSRSIIHKYELFYYDNNGNPIPNAYKFDAIITTYEMILSEIKFLSSVNWRVAVVDEAHRLKNKKCKLLESLSYLNLEHRVLLTGTPLQNNLDELYSLLSFLDPSGVPSEKTFLEEFGNLQSTAQVTKLQAVLKPVMLRRLKEDVEKNLAPKEETIIEVEMTTIQKRIYRSILERNFSFLVKGTTTTNMPNLMNTMMELRKCCNHPFLIKGCEDKIISEYATGDSEMVAAHHLKWLIESSGKMVLVDKLLPKLKSNGHKVLIFSQMVKVLDLIEEYLVQKMYTFERIDGSIRGNLRQSAIDRFSRPESDRFAFLLCTKAGGLGINLTAADTVIIFDSDWNPQNDIQAQARCHRIGQSKSVKVYRLICRRTYEREMFDRASLKLGLDKAVLQNINSENDPSKLATLGDKNNLSKNDIESLLKRGAYGALMDEDVSASAQFCAEDIDQILERRSQVVRLAGEYTGSTFAKASFNAQTKGDIDVDDPDFWEKWAIKAKVSLGKGTTADLIFDKPRERKKVNYNDPEGDFMEVNSDPDDYYFSESFLHNPYRFCWLRVECFKTEKQLLIYGWDRWDDIFKNAGYKTRVTMHDIRNISKTVIVYCWHFAKLEISTKSFIEQLINSTFEGSEDDPKNNNRNKQIKKLQSGKHRYYRDKQSPCAIEVGRDWMTLDPSVLILDNGYRKHLQQNANKILLRMRLMHVLRHDILGNPDQAKLAETHVDNIPLCVKLPQFSSNMALSSWWNDDCDKSLLVGSFKYGYEKYKDMIHDPLLIFQRIVPKEAIQKLIEQEQELALKAASQPLVTDNVPKKRGRKRKNPLPMKKPQNENSDFSTDDEQQPENDDDLGNDSMNVTATIHADWPQTADLNTRFRRLVTSFWKNKPLVQEQMDKQRKILPRVKANDLNSQGKLHLTRKEENDFCKAVFHCGFHHILVQDDMQLLDLVEMRPVSFLFKFRFVWDNFRRIRGFEKRDDKSLSLYALYFLSSCEYLVTSVHGLRPVHDNISIYAVDVVSLPMDFKLIENLTLEKAVKALNRIDMFERLRYKVLPTPGLDERILSTVLPAVGVEFPEWWEEAKHDLMLLKFAGKYGLTPTEKQQFFDQEFDLGKLIGYGMERALIQSLQKEGINSVSDLSFEVLNSMLKWPKPRITVARLKRLLAFILTGVWPHKDCEVDDKYRSPVKMQPIPLIMPTAGVIPSPIQMPIMSRSSPTMNSHEGKSNLLLEPIAAPYVPPVLDDIKPKSSCDKL